MKRPVFVAGHHVVTRWEILFLLAGGLFLFVGFFVGIADADAHIMEAPSWSWGAAIAWILMVIGAASMLGSILHTIQKQDEAGTKYLASTLKMRSTEQIVALLEHAENPDVIFKAAAISPLVDQRVQAALQIMPAEEQGQLSRLYSEVRRQTTKR